MKSNAPYSSARRAQNQQVAWNPVDAVKRMVGVKDDSQGSQSQGGDVISKQSRDKANTAGRALEQTSPLGNAAVNNTRKASTRTSRRLEEMGE